MDGNQVYPIEQGDIEIRSCETDGPMYVGGLPGTHSSNFLLFSKACERFDMIMWFSNIALLSMKFRFIDIIHINTYS